MSSGQLYPFERNRYYPGKMLTSVDFQAEQNYHINKGCFINNLMFGAGVVCGLGVFTLDDLSVLIESGVAIDGYGREIVVDSSVVKKLSAIEGFDSLTGNEASLRIRFKEQNIHSVYSVSHNEPDKEYEYNRISEGYELFLTDKEEEDKVYDFVTELLTRQTLFKSQNFIGEVIVPTIVCKNRNLKVVLEIKKLSNMDINLNCHGILETPVFLSSTGDHFIEIGADDLRLKQGQVYRKEYWVNVQDVPEEETDIILRSGSSAAFEDDKAIGTVPNFSIKIKVSDKSPIELISTETGKINLEMRNTVITHESIHLADIHLERTDNAYLIDDLKEPDSKRYIMAPGTAYLRNRYLEYYVKDVDIRERRTVTESASPVTAAPDNNSYRNFSTGILEIPLGKNARQGDIRYSGEIAHGLGKGNVYVEIGYDYVSDDPDIGSNVKSTIYGNPELFSKQSDRLVDVETAVKVLNEKGSFVVGARLLRNVDYLVLTFRWVAIRFPAGDDTGLTEDYYDKSISVDTPTVIMGAKESHFFGVRFNNMKKSSVTYELTSPGSGEISSDGIYTAPSKEGVYEIRIYCTDMPVICTYAYAIVKKQMLDDREGTGVDYRTTGDGK